MRFFKLTLAMACSLFCLPLLAAAQSKDASLDKSIADMLDAYKKTYPADPVEFQFTPQPTVVAPLVTNQRMVLLYPNQNEPSVQQTHAQDMRTPLLDNRTEAQVAPNENQPSNEDYIRNQLKAMGL